MIRPRVAAAVALAAALVAAIASAQPRQAARAAAVENAATRVAFVPLDDRPRSFGDIQRLADLAGVELITPPAAILSRHFKTGDGDAIARWLDGLDLDGVDAAIVSIDMLAYGGLIGSRTGRVLEADAKRRVEALGRLKARRPGLQVLAFASILRLAPNHDGSNPRWNAALARWAAIAPAGARDAAAAAATAEVEASLPAGMLDRYKALRARNVAVTSAAIEQLGRGEIDFLVVGDDEQAEAGVHAGERLQLQGAVEKTGRQEQAAFKQGIVDVAPLLLARALTRRGSSPQALSVRYSSAEVEQAHAPVVESALRVAGLRAEARAPVALEVFGSGEQAPAEVLAKRVTAAGARTAVADVAEVGTGSALGLIEVLRSRKALRAVTGFAAGPTPSAALSAAIAHAVAFERGLASASAGPDRARQIATAHLNLLLRRVVTDVLLADVIAPQAVDEVLAPRKFDPEMLDDRARLLVQEYIHGELEPLAQSLAADFGGAAWRLPGKTTAASAVIVKDLTELKVELPWSRMDEPDVTFTLHVEPARTAPRPPGPKIL